MAAKIKIEDRKENEKVDSEQIETKEQDSQDSNKKEKKKSTVKELEVKLEAKELEAKDNYDRFLRVSAEFENYRKRSTREMSDFKKFANESLLKEILLIADNLELALSSATENENSEGSIREGVDLTLKEVLKILDNFGVKPIEALKKPFDPNFHQAMMQEESEEHTEQVVLRELQKGYMIHDRLLRPAMVVVSKLKEQKE